MHSHTSQWPNVPTIIKRVYSKLDKLAIHIGNRKMKVNNPPKYYNGIPNQGYTEKNFFQPLLSLTYFTKLNIYVGLNWKLKIFSSILHNFND